jgi:hypothetical protein
MAKRVTSLPLRPTEKIRQTPGDASLESHDIQTEEVVCTSQPEVAKNVLA